MERFQSPAARQTLAVTGIGVAAVLVTLIWFTSGAGAASPTALPSETAGPAETAQPTEPAADATDPTASEPAASPSSAASTPTAPRPSPTAAPATLARCIAASDGSDLSIWRCGRKTEFRNDPSRDKLLYRFEEGVLVAIVPSIEVCESLSSQGERDACRAQAADNADRIENARPTPTPTPTPTPSPTEPPAEPPAETPAEPPAGDTA